MLGRHERPGRSKPVIQRVAASLAAVLAFLLPLAVAAQVNIGLDYATAIGLATTDIRTVIARVISYFLGLLGIIAVGIAMYGGWVYMTSKGEPGEVERAKKIIVSGVIGLMIILSAYAITQFIINSFKEAGLLGEDSGGGYVSGGFGRTPAGMLGSGMIEYHYPTAGQTNVARNTRISITFKKPLFRSSIFRGYSDGGTYELADDRYCPDQKNLPADLKTCPLVCSAGTCLKEFALNTDTLKVIPQADLGTGAFDAFYAKALNNPSTDPALADGIALRAKVTDLPDTLDTTLRQTLVIMPAALLGSGDHDVDYRVKVRGGAAGVKVWVRDAKAGTNAPAPAFADPGPNDPYFWPFTTGTLVDNVPPKLLFIQPNNRQSVLAPTTAPIDRNQVLQMTFDEPVDPTVVSGAVGAVPGVKIEARCIAGLDCVFGCEDLANQNACNASAMCLWNASASKCAYNAAKAGDADPFRIVPGKLRAGNRNQTVEFVPDRACEGVSTNSCGETVYCLPKNVELHVTAVAASVGSNPPASSADDGVIDMAANSFDGNMNGKAEGKSKNAATCSDCFNLNAPQTDLKTILDSARWTLKVGENIDLVPPAISDLDPKSVNMPGVTATTSYAAAKGPSAVPSDIAIKVSWTKDMMMTSAQPGAVGDIAPPDAASPVAGTVALEQYFCSKNAPGCTTGAEGCPAGTCPIYIGFSPYFPTSEDIPPAQWGRVMQIDHQAIPTPNDLGFTEKDDLTGVTPSVVPLVGAQMRDLKQNCFYPSTFSGQVDTSKVSPACNSADPSNPNCCNMGAVKQFDGSTYVPFTCPAKP